MKIVAISGSLRAGSTNTALVRAAAGLAPEGMEVAVYDGLGGLPHFSPERDGDAAPDAVRDLRALLGGADGVLICTPEYAFGMPGSLKNALDWLVTSGELWRKPVAALSASPSALGGEKAHAALVLTLSALEAHIAAEASLLDPVCLHEGGQKRHGDGPGARTGASGVPRRAGAGGGGAAGG